MKKDGVIPVRCSEEDRQLLAAIQKKTGIDYKGEVFRQGIRFWAAKLGIKPTANK